MEMSTEAHYIAEKLMLNDFEVYVVGGAVRDMLMNKIPSDIDFATNATPDQLNELFSDKKLNYVGTEFKVTIIDGIEVATYRYDVYDNRGNLKDVHFARSIEEDLSRRDLTINAMAMDPFTKEIIDPWGGKKDLKDRKIKFVGDPKARITEDPIRILRACRFLALIDGRFSKDTFIAMLQNSGRVLSIPKERYQIEIVKAMKAQKASKFFIALKNLDILKDIFPDLDAMENMPGGKYHNENVFEHSMMAGDFIVTDNPMLKLGAYLHDIGKPICYNLNCDGSFIGHQSYGRDIAKRNLEYLKFSTEEINFVKDCIRFHMMHIKDLNKTKIRRMLNKFRTKRESNTFDFEDFLKIRWADENANTKKKDLELSVIETNLYTLRENVNKVLNEKPVLDVNSLALNGNDIMEILNIKPGPEIKEIKENLFQFVLEDPNKNNKEDLIHILKNILLY